MYSTISPVAIEQCHLIAEEIVDCVFRMEDMSMGRFTESLREGFISVELTRQG
ncbi:hypothetical protein GJ688_01760 [Heliobacillus mobilis]|uniref:Uncharacterized protein n=1 Tax=Heliobacterium mobile TaxID=28064 RepID=A0A6I3SBA3_HELMO|nr:hypothetical protein [Heliobacterium mobile]MTV47707.1 hypothetical protein [Heliobacterium mobile]